MTVVYGKNSVDAYLEYAPQEVKEVLLAEGLHKSTMVHFEKQAAKAKIPITILTKKVLERRLEAGAVHQGIAAVVKAFPYADFMQVLDAVKKRVKSPFFLLLDQLQDPRNLGAILRTADCAGGVDGIIITKHHSTEIRASVLKASTGAALNIPIIRVTNARTAIQTLKKAGIWLGAVDMTGTINYRDQKYDLPLCLVIGGEDKGVRPIIKKEADFLVYIPMHSPTVTSLNVSVAASLVLYEVAYQRSG